MSFQVIFSNETCICILAASYYAGIPLCCFMDSINMAFKVFRCTKALVTGSTLLRLSMISHVMAGI